MSEPGPTGAGSSRTRLARLRAAFDAALDAPPSEREAAILASCEGDSDLAGEVRALVYADTRLSLIHI